MPESILYCRICVNVLCKVTGGNTPVDNQDHDCSGGSPIRGRYITLQRYNTKLKSNGNYELSALVLSEVDVEFYV